MENNQQYYCKHCGWKGTKDELQFDSVETCLGPDEIEICPECGSAEVFIQFVKNM